MSTQAVWLTERNEEPRGSAAPGLAKELGTTGVYLGGAPAELGTPGRTREELFRSLCSDGRPSALSCLGSLKVTCPVSRDAVWLPALAVPPCLLQDGRVGSTPGTSARKAMATGITQEWWRQLAGLRDWPWPAELWGTDYAF